MTRTEILRCAAVCLLSANVAVLLIKFTHPGEALSMLILSVACAVTVLYGSALDYRARRRARSRAQ